MRLMTRPSAPGCGCAGVSAALHMLRSLAGVSACDCPNKPSGRGVHIAFNSCSFSKQEGLLSAPHAPLACARLCTRLLAMSLHAGVALSPFSKLPVLERVQSLESVGGIGRSNMQVAHDAMQPARRLSLPIIRLTGSEPFKSRQLLGLPATGCCSREVAPCLRVMARGTTRLNPEQETILGLACDRLLQLGAGALFEGDGEGHDDRHLRVHVHCVHTALLGREHIQMPVRLHVAGSKIQSCSAHHSGRQCILSASILAWLQLKSMSAVFLQVTG